MAVRSEIKRIILKGIYRSALANSQTLREALDLALDAQYEKVSTGQIVASTSGSGYSVSYSIPSSTGLTPVDVAEAISDLDDLYDCALANASPQTDDGRYTWMLGKIKTPASIGHRFTSIKL